MIAPKMDNDELWLLALTAISTTAINLEMDMFIQSRFLLNSKIMNEVANGAVQEMIKIFLEYLNSLPNPNKDHFLKELKDVLNHYPFLD